MNKTVFQHNIAPFAQLMAAVLPAQVTNNLYAQQYFAHLQENSHYYLSIYADLLEKAMAHSNYSKGEITLLDFGCGNGWLALFAKYSGIPSVIACDRSAIFLAAAEQLSLHLELPIEQWILGDESTVENAVATGQINLCIGSDVIEHVYSIPKVLQTLKALNPAMLVLFTTASVQENPIKRRQLQRLMWRDEQEDSDAEQSEEAAFAGMPFLRIREIIIAQAFPQLPQKEVLALAIQTRGLVQRDILHQIESSYFTTATIKYAPPDAYNTCNPITGSFTERLLPIGEYQQLFEGAGFQFSYYTGFYNSFHSTPKAVLLWWINILLRVLGKKGLMIAPYSILIGKKGIF